MSAGWPWNRLGATLEAARLACVPRSQPGHAENAALFHAAWAAVWPPGFLQDVERCKAGDAAGLESVLLFAEAPPRFFRSGYVLQDCVHWMTRPPRTERQAERMAALVVESVEGRLRLPFRYIPSLARAVDSAELRAALRRNADGTDEKARTQAIQVLDRLQGPPWNPERARLRKVENRLGSQLASAYRSRSATLVRRVLATDPLAAGSGGRLLIAVTFEMAMNWGLLPDEELLEVLRSLDGPEMDSIWRFALRRLDMPGDRARWLWRQLEKGVAPLDAWRGAQTGQRPGAVWAPEDIV